MTYGNPLMGIRLQESAFATVAATVAASAELAASVVQASIPAHVTAAQNVMRKVGVIK